MVVENENTFGVMINNSLPPRGKNTLNRVSTYKQHTVIIANYYPSDKCCRTRSKHLNILHNKIPTALFKK